MFVYEKESQWKLKTQSIEWISTKKNIGEEKSRGDSKASFFFFFFSMKKIDLLFYSGKIRQITQPYKEDIIIMDALSLLLNVIFENLFFTYSHGFRKEKGH